MLHEKSCLIINMPKVMIIKVQQFVKTNTFSLSFHILFSHFCTFSPFFPKTHQNQDLGMGKNGVGPPQKWGWTPQKWGWIPPDIVAAITTPRKHSTLSPAHYIIIKHSTLSPAHYIIIKRDINITRALYNN